MIRDQIKFWLSFVAVLYWYVTLSLVFYGAMNNV